MNIIGLLLILNPMKIIKMKKKFIMRDLKNKNRLSKLMFKDKTKIKSKKDPIGRKVRKEPKLDIKKMRK